MTTFVKPTSGHSRGTDKYGSGQFDASRDGGKRRHEGLDFIARPGEPVKSPISGYFVRFSRPYKKDERYHGVVIRGSGEFEGIEIKMFYVTGLCFGDVKAGDIIGYAQNLDDKYPGISNHVHMEVRKDGQLMPPGEFYNSSW